jgi:hypothetical protein
LPCASGTLTILCRAPRHQTHGKGNGAPGAWTNLCRASRGTTHGKGSSPPCAMDQSLPCVVPRGARQRAGSTLRLDHSLPCALPRGARQRVLLFPCVLRGARQRGCDVVSPRTAVNTFSLPCVTYYARQRTVSCVAFFQSARQSSLPGKNASGANVHGKGGVVRIPPFSGGSRWLVLASTDRVVVDGKRRQPHFIRK